MLAAMLAGCGGESGSSSSTTEHAATQSMQSSTNEPHTQTDRGFAPNPYREPKAPKPHPDAKVDRVIVRNVKRGSGRAVRPGDGVWADYIEANYTTGHKFLRSWGPDRTENMVLTPYSWMRGLIIGMKGMRPGGRRIIIVPRRLSDVDPAHTDRRGNSYHEIVYFDIVLRAVVPPPN